MPEMLSQLPNLRDFGRQLHDLSNWKTKANSEKFDKWMLDGMLGWLLFWWHSVPTLLNQLLGMHLFSELHKVRPIIIPIERCLWGSVLSQQSKYQESDKLDVRFLHKQLRDLQGLYLHLYKLQRKHLLLRRQMRARLSPWEIHRQALLHPVRVTVRDLHCL